MSDVVIVGAGLAGLAAARRLQHDGRTVLVLEATSHVGGRARTHMLDGTPADLGGEWVGSAHRRVHRLAHELGVGIEPAGTLGYPVRWRLPSGDHVSRLPPRHTWRTLGRVLREGGALSRGVQPDQPWNAPQATDLDAQSLADWFSSLEVDDDTSYLLERIVGSLSSSSTEEMSLLQFLWWMRMAGGPLRTLRTTFQSRIVGGAQQLAQSMSAAVPIRLGQRVTSVEQNDDVVVRTDAGLVHHAQHAVVAVPLSVLDHINFQPGLPRTSGPAPQVRPGTKVVALLPEGKQPPPYHTVVGGSDLWVAWRRGQRVTGFSPPQADAEDREALIADLGAAFHAAPGSLSHVTVKDWSTEATIAGCDVAFAPTEVCRWAPVLRQGHGRVRFAGAERSSWPNNMEGALESGEVAATSLAFL